MTAWTSSPFVVLQHLGCRRAQEVVADVEREVTPQRAVFAMASSSVRVLGARPGSQLDQGVGPGQRGDRGGVQFQQSALGPGGDSTHRVW